MKEQKNAVDVNAGENNVWMFGAQVLIVGLIAGFLIGWFWHKNTSEIKVSDEAQKSSMASNSATSTTPVPEIIYKTIEAPAFVSVDDQRAGGLVFIKHVEAKKPTWIAIRDVEDGEIGNILGAEMITGETDDVPVTLLRQTEAGEKYSVFLYQDEGDGEFDFKTDLLITQNKKPVSATFVAQ